MQVRGLAKQMGIDLNTVKGTGAAGAAPPVPLPVWVPARPDPSISLDPIVQHIVQLMSQAECKQSVAGK